MCPIISDLLKSEFISKLVSSTLKKGQVYRMNLTKDEGVNPKSDNDNSRNKYFVIVGHDIEGNAIGFVLINSLINNNLPQSIKDLHYPLKARDYKFLSNDSFVNCSDLKTINKTKFDFMFPGDCYKGDIDPKELEYIINTVKSSPNITPKMIKKFGL